MKNHLIKNVFFLILFTALTTAFSSLLGLNHMQLLAVSVFSATVFGTLFFWEFRLAIAFLGISILLLTKTLDLESFIKFASLEVILFLASMMIILGWLKETGFFAWLIGLILRIKRLTGVKFIIVVSIFSALLSCVMDEVTSIIFMIAGILEICEFFEINPLPYVTISVMATNIGSSGTVLGNPIGILIATKAGLTFEDFLIHAFPIMILALLSLIALMSIWYKKEANRLTKRIQLMADNEIFMRLISVPPTKEIKKALTLFGVTVLLISLHHRIEIIFNLPENTVLLLVPLASAGLVMIIKHRKARKYIEQDVDWWTLIFFMLLFAKAGTLKYTGVTDVFAGRLINFFQASKSALVSIVLWLSAFCSSILDNVILVAAFIPVIQSFQTYGFILNSLWWALLFGGCLGGNITMVGSTANIVALGILEKEAKIKVTFFRWFWVGLIAGVLTTSVVWLFLLLGL